MILGKNLLKKSFSSLAKTATLTPIFLTMYFKNKTNSPLLCHFIEVNNILIKLPPTATIIKGSYENKIRRSSPIEKIFEVFATVRREGSLFMTYFDLMKAITPFNYSNKDINDMKEYLKEKPPKTLIKLVDLDESGDISVVEYYVFWILHEINVPDLINYFGKDLSKELSKQEISQFFKERGNQVKIGLTETYLPDGRLAKVNAQFVEESIDSFINNLFEFDQKENITLESIVTMKRDLRREIYEFEFNTFDLTEGKMKAEDFAKSLISYVEPRKVKRYLSTLDNLSCKDALLTLEDYIAFKEFVIDDLDEFEANISKYGIYTRKKFHSVISKLSEDNDYKLTEVQRNIMFEVLDIDGNGKIDESEYLSVLKNAKKLGRDIEETAVGYSMAPITDLKELSLKWADKMMRIYEIIMED